MHIRPARRDLPVPARNFIWLLLAMAVWCASLAAHAAERIGRVVIAAGEVTATNADGEVRLLDSGDNLFEGEVLRTGDGGRVQVRFVDGGRLALRPSTEMAIDQYKNRVQEAASRVSMRLRRGGFRAISGRIGRVNRRAYAVSTPYARIGIRGTDWGASLVELPGRDPLLVVGVNDGGVTVSNDAGSIPLGADVDFSYAQVESSLSPPIGLTAPPDELGASMSLEVPVSTPEDEEGPVEATTEELDAAGDDESGADGDQLADGDADDGQAEPADSSAAADDGMLAGDDGGGAPGEVLSETGDLMIELDSGGDEAASLFEFGNRCL